MATSSSGVRSPLLWSTGVTTTLRQDPCSALGSVITKSTPTRPIRSGRVRDLATTTTSSNWMLIIRSPLSSVVVGIR